MSWVRLWHDMPTDPKWRVISRKSGRSVSEVIAVFTFVMVNASANANERGRTHNLFADEIAAALDLDDGDVEAILGAMEGKVMRDGELTGWEARQPKREDNSALRSKEWRERKKAERNRTQTNANERPDTDTDTDKNISSLRSDILGPTSPKPSPSRGQRLVLTELPTEWRDWACEEGHSRPDAEWQTFRDYWVAQPGQKGVKVDWQATWRNWVRRSIQRGNPVDTRSPVMQTLARMGGRA